MSGAIETSPVAWLDADEDGAWRAWLQLSEEVRARVSRDLQAECGMSEPDYAVLVVLSEHPDHRIRMSDLAAELRWSKSRLSHQVTRMEARGQVAKEGCDGDARGWYAVLTDSGLRDIRQAAPLHVASVRRHFIDALDRRELASLHAIADTVLAHLAGNTAGCPSATADACAGGPEERGGCAED